MGFKDFLDNKPINVMTKRKALGKIEVSLKVEDS